MAQNKFIKGLDQPVAEWLSPLNSAATLSTPKCTVASNKFLRHDPETSRYHYHFYSGGVAGLKYDIENGNCINIRAYGYSQTPAAAFCQSKGFRSLVISATSNSITGSFYDNVSLVGKKIKIIKGKGKGQQRVITSISETIHDFGAATAASSTFVTDSNKNWGINQWFGYQINVLNKNIFFTCMQNSSTSLRQNPPNHSEYYEYNFMSYAVAIGDRYSIVSQTAQINSPWDVIPDNTSEYEFDTGLIYIAGANRTNTNWNLVKYDILSGNMFEYPNIGYLGFTGMSNFGQLDITVSDSIYNLHLRSNADVQDLQPIDLQKLKDGGNYVFENNEFLNKYIFIYSGLNKGFYSRITGNNADTLDLENPLPEVCDISTQYEIVDYVYGMQEITTADTLNNVQITLNNASFDTDELKNMTVEIVSGKGIGNKRKILSNSTNTIKILNFDEAPDSSSVFLIQNDSDDIYLKTLRTNTPLIQVINTNNNILTLGRYYDDGMIASAVIKKSKDSFGISISSTTFSSNILTINTIVEHNFKTGDRVYIQGDTGAFSAINNDPNGYICTVTSQTQLTINTGASGGNMTIAAQSSTVIKVAGKNWGTNALVGKTITYAVWATGINLVSYPHYKITANTSDTITISPAGTSSINNSRFIISPNITETESKACIGMDDGGVIVSAGTSVTTFTDSTKNYAVNSLVGRSIVFLSHTLSYSSFPITANTATTITIGTAITNFANTTYAIVNHNPDSNIANCCRLIYVKNSLYNGILMTHTGIEPFRIINFKNDSAYIIPANTSTAILQSTAGNTNSWIWDGDRYLYFKYGITSKVTNIYRYDILKNSLEPWGITPIQHAASQYANDICIVKYNGYKYLIVNRAASASTDKEIWRFLIID